MGFDEVCRWDPELGQGMMRFPATWTQGRSVFGGLQGAALMRAMLEQVEPTRRPRSFTLTCCAPVAAELPTRVEAAVLRSGKNVTFVEARLSQGDATVAAASATFGADRPSEITIAAAPPRPAPPVDRVPRVSHHLPGVPRFVSELDMRVFEGAPYSGGEPAVGAWLRLEGAATMGPAELIALCDAPPPAPVVRLARPAPASTADLTVQFLHPAPLAGDGWLLYRSACTWADAGYAEFTATLWAGKTAVARVRQAMTVFG